MGKSNILIMLLLWISVLGCRTYIIKDPPPPSYSSIKLDSVDFEDLKSSVEKKLGKASEYREYKKDELWIYDNSFNGTQLGAITFDSRTQKVKGITFVPDLDSRESKIDFLKEQKFSHLKFEEVLPNRCQKDFISTSIFFINKKEGIIIRYNRHSQLVESYSKVQSSYMDGLVDDIKNCP